MTPEWAPEIECRFTELRLRKINGSLTKNEQEELAKIRSIVTKIETQTITPALNKLESEQTALKNTLQKLQYENNELLQLFDQQALLIADTKRWLGEFEQRYALLQNRRSHLSNLIA